MPTKAERDIAEFKPHVRGILDDIASVEADIAKQKRQLASGTLSAADARLLNKVSSAAAKQIEETLGLLERIGDKLEVSLGLEKAALKDLVQSIDKAREGFVIDADTDPDEIEVMEDMLKPAAAAAACFTHEDLFSGREETLGRCYLSLHKAYKAAEDSGYDAPNPFKPVFDKVQALYHVEGLPIPDDLFPFKVKKRKAKAKEKKPKAPVSLPEMEVFHAQTRGRKWRIRVMDNQDGTFTATTFKGMDVQGRANNYTAAQISKWVQQAIDGAREIDGINYIVKKDTHSLYQEPSKPAKAAKPKAKPAKEDPTVPDAAKDKLLTAAFQEAVIQAISKVA